MPSKTGLPGAAAKAVQRKQGRRVVAGIHYRVEIADLHAHLFRVTLKLAKRAGLVSGALLLLGVLVIAVHTAIYLGISATVPYWPQKEMDAFRRDMNPGPAEVARELEICRGSWSGQLPHRAKEAFMFETFLFAIWTGWRAGWVSRGTSARPPR